jgi:hemoglobin-like flavoprotein
MLTETQKTLVQSSFANVAPISEQAADLFYGRLFELDPSLRALFKSDLKEQKKKLMQMLAAAVRGLDDLGALVPVVRDLGARHGGYGVKDEHYDTVAEALLWTLEKGLGDAFTPETKDAWIAVYGVLSSTMKDSARAAMAART